MKKLNILWIAAICLWAIGCNPAKQEAKSGLAYSSESFGQLSDGTAISLYTLSNSQGMEAKVISYGGIITSLTVPDKDDNMGDVVLGFDKIEDYVAGSPYFGALIGRYGNRIAQGKFTLDSVEYTLPINDGVNHLHGGPKGFDKVVWNVEPFQNDSTVGLVLRRISPDMEQGYPGNLSVEATYTLNEQNQLIFEYKATTDKKTVINLTNHSYFNLTGDASKSILDHELELPASTFLGVDNTLIPDGALTPVVGTPFDFQAATKIGARINAEDTQLAYGLGYDHCWVYTDSSSDMKFGGSLYDPTSGRLMKFYTTEPAVQFYSGNFLDGKLTGKGGTIYQQRSGLCLETQHYPDSPNQSQFPSTELAPGETYYTKSIYEFSVK